MTPGEGSVRRSRSGAKTGTPANGEQSFREIRLQGRSIAVLIGCLLVAFWTTVGVPVAGVGVSLLRAVFGILFLTVVPGTMLFVLIDNRIDRFGELLVYAVGSSLVFLAATSVLTSVLYSLVGIDAPLSVLPFALTVSAVTMGAMGVAYWRDRRLVVRVPSFSSRDAAIGAVLVCLPLFSALAAGRMNAIGSNRLMYAFLLAVAVVVLVSIKVVPSRLYPLAVFTVAVGIVLHRNLITGAVVGSDIQVNYFFVELLLEAGAWEPAMGDVYSSIPVVGAVPAVYSVVTGIDPAMVFKLLYSLLFALVPVVLYYTFEDVFGKDAAFVGAYFFVFYFRSFNGTPGKTRIAQLFMILVILTMVTDRERLPGKEWIGALFGAGMILSHYTTTYIFVISLGVAYGLGWIYRAYSGEDAGLRIAGVYAVAFGGAAVGWYAITTPGMLQNVAGVLADIPTQIYAVLSGESIHRSGASAVQEESGIAYTSTLLLHMALMGLAGIGVLSQILVRLFSPEESRPTEPIRLAILAVPMLMFLGASYFVSGNLGADRMYQIVLTLLAGFMPVGYLALVGLLSGIRDIDTGIWRPVLVALAVLLLLNTGVAYNAIGEPVTSDIGLDADTHSLAYTDAEIDGGEWIDDTSTGSPVIYTDSYTGEMFRAIVPETYSDASVRQIKVDWLPGIEFSEGYVYVRDRAVVDGTAYDGETPQYYLTEAERDAIERSTNKVYTSGEADVFRYEGTESQQFGRNES
ncbi:DUF2206 domain-containing protein [Halalkalicoccus jeotgali]|uniref:Transmembrane protein n=1 Tax=Halalkalicoccus jeotgali (strain DSM 18796 / CECT 7217 / JCM 14584 / KCTC 4019 / B3) TaxID=795797 RepID=D8J7W7_HALJB|nr:DUF2206 domain-containing protein [Halalkalicoccus jeotgali]ADJ14080.1 transmembrane protein [Halalkalicoccus jeotgali B3]ELY33876.1 transmembrane protein [Halalkalicoccus jeotgali B3]